MRITGNDTTATNRSYLEFTDSASTSLGYVGDGSYGKNGVQLVSHHADGLNLFAFSGGDIDLRTSSAANGDVSRLKITNAGNVGIGTPSPESNLTVVNSGSSRGISSEAYGTAYGGAIWARGARGTVAAPSATLLGDYLGWFVFDGYNGANWTASNNQTGLGALASQNWTATANGNHLVFYTIGDGTTSATEKMRISQNGNVGIGAPVPTAKLQIMGSTAITTITDTGINLSLQNSVTSNNWNFYNLPSTDVAPNALLFENCVGSPSACTRKMVITPTGNVGIGTTTPSAKLEVNGDLKVGNTTPGLTTCTAAQGGATRYNSTSKVMEYCNETNWVAMGGSSPPGTHCGNHVLDSGGGPPTTYPVMGRISVAAYVPLLRG